MKAHTCSDRFDIHAKMDDRACDWSGDQVRLQLDGAPANGGTAGRYFSVEVRSGVHSGVVTSAGE